MINCLFIDLIQNSVLVYQIISIYTLEFIIFKRFLLNSFFSLCFFWLLKFCATLISVEDEVLEHEDRVEEDRHDGQDELDQIECAWFEERFVER